MQAAEKDEQIAAFVEECRRGGTSEVMLESMEKRGMYLGIDALHPITGARVPVWVANFVLMGYGTGAVMAVPGHDVRDHAFAQNYGLPIVQVIEPNDGTEIDISAEAYVAYGKLVNSGEFDGLDSDAASCAPICAQMVSKGGISPCARSSFRTSRVASRVRTRP